MLCNSTAGHLGSGREGTVPKLAFPSPTPLWKLSPERHRGPSLLSPPPSHDTDLYGIIHESLQQQRLPSSGWRQQGTSHRQPRTTTLGQFTACPARPPWLSPGDLQRREKTLGTCKAQTGGPLLSPDRFHNKAPPPGQGWELRCGQQGQSCMSNNA